MQAQSWAPSPPSAQAGGLDLEDADDTEHTAFGGLADAVRLGLLPEAAIDSSVSRLMCVQ